MRFKSTLVLLAIFAALGSYVYFGEYRGQEGRQKKKEAAKPPSKKKKSEDQEASDTKAQATMIVIVVDPQN